MKHLRNQPQKPVVNQQTPQSSVVEKQTMTFETVNENDNADDGKKANVGDAVVRLRAKQAALDVVLDHVSLMRAQARLMDVLDINDWNQAAILCKEEVARLRGELTEGASFEDLVYAAEDSGEDILAFAERLGVDVSRISDALQQRGTVKI